MRKSLIDQEKKTTIWFLWLFYVIYVAYDLVYYNLLPVTVWESTGLHVGDIKYWIYPLLFGLLAVSIPMLKMGKYVWTIKYFYFIIFTLFNIISDIIFYFGKDITYSNGNVVEIVIVLFSPIFVNKRFFYLAAIGTALKYVVVGTVLKDPAVFLPLVLIAVFAIIAYILLNRFIAYLTAVEDSYDKQLDGIVKGIIATLELKDPYTKGHSVRVAEYSMILAKATGKFNESTLKSFYYSCLLHDIGKVNIPDAILTKPGKLTKDEFDIIKTHPVVGEKAVQEVEGITETINVIRHHHERWDGNGYPDGLKGEEIDSLARIASIADAFDAMTSSRSYRLALSLEEANTRILAGRDTQFDPNLIVLYKKIFPLWTEYHRKYNSDEDIKGGEIHENP